MDISSKSFDADSPIPSKNSFCAIADDPSDHVTMADNKNPHLAWSDLPKGTKSLALTVHDPDVPSVGDDVNQEGRTVPADLDRVDFYHWVLVDLDPEKGEIAEGEFSDGVTAGGKDGPRGPGGTRQGLNNYTQWFEGDEEMGGDYYGYDGPCPPWNDEIIHRYVFTLYALDVEEAPVEGTFTGPELREAIEGHVLDSSSVVATYTLNPDLA